MPEPGGRKEKPPCAPGQHDLYEMDQPAPAPGADPKIHAISGRLAKYFYCSKCDHFFWESDEALSEDESHTGRPVVEEEEDDDDEDGDENDNT